MTRPRQAKDGLARARVLQVRVTHLELLALARAARRRGLTRSALVRELLRQLPPA